MLSIFKSQKGQGTMKSVKKHGTSKRNTLSAITKKTLGSGNLRAAVTLPPDEDINEWLAANTVDFYNEITLLYSVCEEDAKKFTSPGEGFPPGFEYRWLDEAKKTTIRVTGPEYVDYVMTWVQAQIDDEEIFPVVESQPFPDNFLEYVKDIFKRMFRIFAIIYHRLLKAIENTGATPHLNTVFKHFMFFCYEFDLLQEKEIRALPGPCAKLKSDFDALA